MHLTLHLTRSCNMNCDYCYAPPLMDNGMAVATGKKALEFGASINESSCGIVLFGGEPLLHKDLIKELVEYSYELRKKTGIRFLFKITTNGTLLDGSFLKYSIKNDILIAMSFDGVAKAHNAHRKFKNGEPSYSIVKEKLELLLHYRPYSSVLMVVNPDTVQYLVESIQLLLDLSCRYIILSLNHDANWEESHFKLLEKQFKKLSKKYIKWIQSGKKFYFSPFDVKLSSHINEHCYQKERCELGQHQLSIDPDGYLYPCVQFTKAGAESEWCIGDIINGINQVKRNEIFKLSQDEKESCVNCLIKHRCNNTCGCLNWQTTNSINNVSPVLCRYEQILIPIADKIGEYLFKKKVPNFIQKHYNSAYPILSLIEDSNI